MLSLVSSNAGFVTLRDEAAFAGRSDEVQGTDSEICTVASSSMDSGDGPDSVGSNKRTTTGPVEKKKKRKSFSILCDYTGILIFASGVRIIHLNRSDNEMTSSDLCICVTMSDMFHVGFSCVFDFGFTSSNPKCGLVQTVFMDLII